MKLSRWMFAAAVAAAVAAAGFRLFAHRAAGDRGSEDAATPRPGVSVRPGAVYAPKAEPLRRAPRPPPLGAPAGAGRDVVPDDGDGEDGGADEPAGEGADEAVEAPPPPELRDDDPALAALEPERAFSETVWDSLAASPRDLVAEGARRTASGDPEERALGGVLLFFAEMLEGEVLESVATDPDPLVPLTVLDWVRDFGTDDQIAAFRRAFAGRGAEAEDLLAFAAESAGLVGGGRSALDLFLAGFGEGGIPAGDLARLVASPGASYDVREQALFKLLEPETRTAGEEALRAFADGLSAEDGGLLPFAAGKLAALAEMSNPDGDDEKVWDSEAPVVFFLAQTEGGLQARDLANYLEYALRRDEADFPPVIEEGTWEFANEFLLSAKERTEDLSPVELDALDRIASSLDRLVEYDPAFNPFETVEDDGEDDDDAGDGDDPDDADAEEDGEDGDDPDDADAEEDAEE